MATAVITGIVINPKAVIPGGRVTISCVLNDSTTEALITGSATVTAILRDTKGIALAISPLSLSYSAGRWVGDGAVAAGTRVGRCSAVISVVYSSTTQLSPPEYFDVIGGIGSAGQ